jgi:hypothetical protein
MEDVRADRQTIAETPNPCRVDEQPLRDVGRVSDVFDSGCNDTFTTNALRMLT